MKFLFWAMILARLQQQAAHSRTRCTEFVHVNNDFKIDCIYQEDATLQINCGNDMEFKQFELGWPFFWKTNTNTRILWLDCH